MLLTAHAKINWSLSVTGRREDGYHTLDMLMQSVALSDTLEILPADTLTLSLGGSQYVTSGKKNLVLQAAQMLQGELNVHAGASIRLRKRVPVGAGMGGGSADAAAALLGLDRLWGLKLSKEELCAFGLRLGADVPFCLEGGLARVRGIGEQVESLPFAPCFHLVVVQPCSGLSTPEVFGAYDALDALPKVPDIDAAQKALKKRDLEALAETMGNMLEAASVPKRPEIAIAAQTLEHYGALRAQMTGSGSAVIGLFENRDAAAYTAFLLKRIWPKTFATHTTEFGVLLHDGIK